MTARKRGARLLAKVYIGIGPETGEEIEEEEAYDYALKRCLFGTPRDKQEWNGFIPEIG